MPDARPVLSFKALGITEAEHRALLETRELFANGKFHHDADLEVDRPDGFNMNVIAEDSGCGTTCCIGGWMFMVMLRNGNAPCSVAGKYVQQYRSRPLYPLFFPFTDINRRDLVDADGQEYDFPFELIPPAYALAAIDNFLATGDPNWPEAIQYS